MAPPDMDTVYQAISALYDNPDAAEKEKASLWLGNVQKSIHSWKIADQLLQQKKDIHSCYFAAQTMRSKVQHNLLELPDDSLVSLRDSLVTHLEGTSPETSGPILTQLSLALVDLALQMPTWQDFISDFIKSFANKNDFALLEVLTVLPQEIDSSTMKLGENRREEVKAHLQSKAHIVTSFLKESIVNSQHTHVSLKIVKCMTSWIQVRSINIQEIPQNAVIGYCLQVLREHNSINTLHDAAADCMCALLHCLEENNNNDNIERLLFDSISSLEESYHMSVAHEEEDKAANYARVFTELAETFLEKIVSATASGNTHFAMRSFELALVCVGHHEYEIAEITFSLWYRLSEEVYQRDIQVLIDAFKPHIERLIEALARHCQHEPDNPKIPEDGDEFYEFRMKVMELIKDVVFMVGSSAVFRQMFAALHADMSWEQTEAALFVMQAVAKNIIPDEYEYVPKVVEAILSMPAEAHPAVRKTCILLLGELCEWIEAHPECLEACLQCLLHALTDKQLATAAAAAIRNISAACRSGGGGGGGGGGAAALVRAAAAASSLPLSAPPATDIARALATAMGALPHQQLREAMREAVAQQTAGLGALAAQQRPVVKQSATDPVPILDRLAALFRDVEAPVEAPAADHPCLPALADAWPALLAVLQRYQADARVMERACRCLRFCLRCCSSQAAPLLAPLAAALASLYAAHPHSCVLYLASILVDELSAVDSCVPLLVALLQALMPKAFDLLQMENGLKDNPDTVDDLFRLCIRFVQRIPLQLVQSAAAAAVLRCAALAAALDHRDANASVMKFLYDFARLANSPPHNNDASVIADRLLNDMDDHLIYALIESSVLHLHPYMISDVAEVLVELVIVQKRHNKDWVRVAISRLPFDRQAKPTQEQCDTFHRLVVNSTKCKDTTRLLRDFAKLFR